MNRESAWELLCEYTQTDGLRKHGLAVETVMRYFARKHGADEDVWGITGMLHDRRRSGGSALRRTTSPSAFAAPRVIVARAEKREGTPTVASRWLQRLARAPRRGGVCRAPGRGETLSSSSPATSTASPTAGRAGAAARPNRRSRRGRACSSPRSRRWSATPTPSTPSTCSSSSRSTRSAWPPDYALRGSLIHEALGDVRGRMVGRLRCAAPRQGWSRSAARCSPRSPASPTCMPSGRSASRRSPNGSIAWEARRSPTSPSARPRYRARSSCRRRRPFPAARPRRPHRPPPRRDGRDPRLQDRLAAVGAAGPARLRAAAGARGGDDQRAAAFGEGFRRAEHRHARLDRPRPRRARRAAGPPSRRAGRPMRSPSGSRALRHADRRLRRAGARLPLAGAADVRDALRKSLRPPRARARMGPGRERGGFSWPGPPSP